MENKMKDRLVSLLNNLPEREVIISGCRAGKRLHTAETIAEHLLANGVLVPPCKVGDTVYAVFEALFEEKSPAFIEEWTVKGLNYCGGKWFAVADDNEPFEIGDDFCLLTRKEAEKRLKEFEQRAEK